MKVLGNCIHIKQSNTCINPNHKTICAVKIIDDTANVNIIYLTVLSMQINVHVETNIVAKTRVNES